MFGTYKLRKSLERKILGKSGWPARMLRGILPFFEPWKRSSLDIVRPSGIGDVLLATPVLREIKKLNPEIRIRFFTKLPSLVQGLPFIDEVHTMDHCPQNAYRLRYEDAVPTPFHLTRIFGDCIGVNVSDITPECMVRMDLVDLYRSQWGQGPHVVALFRASQFTPNKDWPIESWDRLIARLSQNVHVVLIGDKPPPDQDITSPEKYTDLRGKTDLENLTAVIAAANLYVGPVSGPSHIAAALDVPSVVICGGYEAPHNGGYPNSVFLSRTPLCSPCWLRTPCPHNLECLTSISVDEVENSIMDGLHQDDSGRKCSA